MSEARRGEGLPLARLCMVIGSLAPLLLLWMVRGIPCVPDRTLIPAGMALVIVPNLVLLARVSLARKANDVQTKAVGVADDQRSHLLVYLFAMLLPLWDVGMGSRRGLAAAIVALVFIVFLFWHLNLYYMNLILAITGYRVFSVYAADRDETATGQEPFVLITKRASLAPGLEIQAYRISNHVFWEKGA